MLDILIFSNKLPTIFILYLKNFLHKHQEEKVKNYINIIFILNIQSILKKNFKLTYKRSDLKIYQKQNHNNRKIIYSNHLKIEENQDIFYQLKNVIKI